jgi:Arylsulfotransferase (ASST)
MAFAPRVIGRRRTRPLAAAVVLGSVMSVRAGNGDATDFDEFLITPWNTAPILADTVATANLTSIGGPADQQVIDGIVQEIDIGTGKVLFQWDVATLIKSDNQPEGLVAGVEGNVQTTRNGDLFVGWGALGYISEFSPSGQLLFNAQHPGGMSTYRAYRLPWHPAS